MSRAPDGGGARPGHPDSYPSRAAGRATSQGARVLGPSGRRAAVAAARCQPRDAAAQLRRGGRLPGGTPTVLGSQALARGNTLRRPSCVHWVRDPLDWLAAERARGSWVLGVELADEAVRLVQLPLAPRRTIAVLGHEQHGIPPEALDLLDGAVEIPMIGTGTSLNVAVAGSLVLYKLAGLS